MSTLSSKQSQLASLADLEALPEPVSLGSRHAPIAHHLLVRTLTLQIQERGYEVRRGQYAVSKDASKLFGVMDLVPPGVVDVTERGLSIGFRNSTDSTLAIKIVAGQRVFVCDNLALSGDLIAVLRRNTTGLAIESELKLGFEKFLKHATALDLHIARLQATLIADIDAKARIFDIFAQRIVPIHLFDDVKEFYFTPGDDMTDCQPRTAWGLHNAFTRAMKNLTPGRGFAANVALGQAFGLVTTQQ